MAKSKTTQRDEQRELTRRALIKWSVAAGAALGVSRAKVFDILEGTAGKGVAFAAAENATARSVHIVAGNGGLAWFQLFWPPSRHREGEQQRLRVAQARSGDGRRRHGHARCVIGPDTPWASLPAGRQVTCFTCGSNETHTQPAAVGGRPQRQQHLLGGERAAGGVAVGDPARHDRRRRHRHRPGWRPPGERRQRRRHRRSVQQCGVARRWSARRRRPTRSLYKAHYDAFIQLNRAANRSTTKTAYTTASRRGAVPRHQPRGAAADHAGRPHPLRHRAATRATNVANIGRKRSSSRSRRSRWA